MHSKRSDLYSIKKHGLSVIIDGVRWRTDIKLHMILLCVPQRLNLLGQKFRPSRDPFHLYASIADHTTRYIEYKPCRLVQSQITEVHCLVLHVSAKKSLAENTPLQSAIQHLDHNCGTTNLLLIVTILLIDCIDHEGLIAVESS